MMIPCLWSLLFGFDALTGVGWKGAPAAASFLVDIPRGLGTAHESKPHWGFDCPACGVAVLFESCTVHHKKIPRPNGLGIVVEHCPQQSNLTDQRLIYSNCQSLQVH